MDREQRIAGRPFNHGGGAESRPHAATADSPDRAALVARWLELTRHVLPGMAAAQGWPIREDHCFMRVCLDAAVGAPWRRVLAPPAIRSMSLDQLAAAVRIAAGIAAQPAILAGLNARSLAGRRAQRQCDTPARASLQP